MSQQIKTKSHPVVRHEGMTDEQAIARAAVHSGAMASYVIDAFQENLLGTDVHFASLIEAVDKSIDRTAEGDLRKLEGMLVGQAAALQTIFASLARRAAGQQSIKHYETLLSLAFKAQAQSRATVQAVVDLKYPRQTVFAKQANVSNGPQQVNNGVADSRSSTRAREEAETPQIKQLEQAQHESFRMDAGASRETVPIDPHLAAMGQINGAAH